MTLEQFLFILIREKKELSLGPYMETKTRVKYSSGSVNAGFSPPFSCNALSSISHKHSTDPSLHFYLSSFTSDYSFLSQVSLRILSEWTLTPPTPRLVHPLVATGVPTSSPAIVLSLSFSQYIIHILISQSSGCTLHPRSLTMKGTKKSLL